MFAALGRCLIQWPLLYGPLHCSDVTFPSLRLKSPVIRLLLQQFVQANTKKSMRKELFPSHDVIIIFVLLQSVLQAAKEMTSPRYKLICHVMIGQLSNQGFLYASRCLWNAKTDTSATAEFHKPQFFCTATVHATYCEWGRHPISYTSTVLPQSMSRTVNEEDIP